VDFEVYHLFNKSIADFRIFNNDVEFKRIIGTIRYYQIEKPQIKFSRFTKLFEETQKAAKSELSFPGGQKLVDVVAYCIMPTHFHLAVQELKDKGIVTFMRNVLNSYTRYFNIKHNRKGPLWEGRFKKTTVESDEQLLHLTRYIHLNAVTAYLVDSPEDWYFSSYREYLSLDGKKPPICEYGDILDIRPDSYREFVEGGISYQRDMAKAKRLA